MTANQPAELSRLFEELLVRYQQDLDRAQTEQELRAAHARYLGKEGDIRKRLAEALRAAPGPDKRAVGQAGNAAVHKAEERFQLRLSALRAALRQRDLGRRVDVTLPGRPRRLGHLHPLSLVRRELCQIFAELGFVVATGPQVETDFHNFEALAVPADHPARDMQDTFYFASGLLLRTHTSPVQVRTMLAQPPPVRIIAPGRAYRKDDDPTHAPMFSQIEGLLVDEGVSFADLKGTLLHFVHRFFGADVGLRLRPSFFPFTEPSAELDIQCHICKGLGTGCRTCKGTGYIEIGGCGMVDPEVFRHVGYDAERYTGFAFGFGIDRMAMLRYGLDDLRLFFSGDARFTRQF